MTPASVAKEYFTRELTVHETTQSKTVVFVHDACYSHRFSRRKSTKASIASIVERPERIHATLLGASTAYVRLGGRHRDGQHCPHPDRDASTTEPPFKIRKTTRSIPLTHPAVVQVHGTKWMEELQVMCDSAEGRLAIGARELQRPIGYGKDDKGHKLPELHAGDLYLAKESLSALQGCLGGVYDAVDAVFGPDETQRAFVCIRPPGHHCSANMPSGFCWLNNVHVGITYAAMTHGLTHAAIIDFDLHHGDGSQAITWAHNETAQNLPKTASTHRKTPIGYYSLHDINSYPCEAGDPEKILNASTCLHNAHGQSIWNVHLEPYRSHAEFWAIYAAKYGPLLEKATLFLAHHSKRLRADGIEPRAAIFLSSGFDASEHETPHMQRHGVNVPTDFYAKFTADIVNIANRSGLGVDGRIISVLEGGYSDRALTSGVLSHLCGLTENTEPDIRTQSPLGLSRLTLSGSQSDMVGRDPAWWSDQNLDCLEAMIAGKMPPPKSDRPDKPPSLYSSPTQASISRMTEIAQERQSHSAQLEAKLWLQNAPAEPVPEVDWVVAAYELSRLLIPEDRQTLSCTYEELNEDTIRTKKDRQSLTSTTSPPSAKMQLRDRRTKQALPTASQVRTSSKSGRRTTIASALDLPDPVVRAVKKEDKPRRRSSAASSIDTALQELRIDEQDVPVGVNARHKASTQATPEIGSGLPVKRTRVPVKKAASTNNSPRKGRSAAKLENTPSRAFDLDQRPILPATSLSRPTTSSGSDAMDELTNGLKKISIKLKMPTEGQLVDKINSVASEPSQLKTKPPRKPPVPRVPKTKATSQKTLTDTSTSPRPTASSSLQDTANTILAPNVNTANMIVGKHTSSLSETLSVPPTGPNEQSQTSTTAEPTVSVPAEILYPKIKEEMDESQPRHAPESNF